MKFDTRKPNWVPHFSKKSLKENVQYDEGFLTANTANMKFFYYRYLNLSQHYGVLSKSKIMCAQIQ